jgi:hypothetical protein
MSLNFSIRSHDYPEAWRIRYLEAKNHALDAGFDRTCISVIKRAIEGRHSCRLW